MSTHSDRDGASPLVALAKIVAIAASGSALVVGTVAAHVYARSFDEQETAPWVSVYEHTAHLHAARHSQAAQRPRIPTHFMWGPSHRCATLRLGWRAC